jgi:hypothetical protein
MDELNASPLGTATGEARMDRIVDSNQTSQTRRSRDAYRTVARANHLDVHILSAERRSAQSVVELAQTRARTSRPNLESERLQLGSSTAQARICSRGMMMDDELPANSGMVRDRWQSGAADASPAPSPLTIPNRGCMLHGGTRIAECVWGFGVWGFVDPCNGGANTATRQGWPAAAYHEALFPD